MIFGWKKTASGKSSRKTSESAQANLIANKFTTVINPIAFRSVTLPPNISRLNLGIPSGAWVILEGDDDFSKALFCDLCFGYIEPEGGKIEAVLNEGDVTYLGRSNTTYGDSFLDHLYSGVKSKNKELANFLIHKSLPDRFKRNLSKHNLFEFKEGKKAHDLELDERDYLELAEANALLQMRKAMIIDTSTDFYQIALEQGFRHSKLFLSSGKLIFWIVDPKHPLPADAQPWKDGLHKGELIRLSFSSESPQGYIN